MGYALEWLAVKGGRRDTVLEALGLRGTGELCEITEAGSIYGAALPSGWYAVIDDHVFAGLCSDHNLAALSAGTEAIRVFVEEHVMCASAAAWRDGRKVWEVEHASEKGKDHLHTQGSLPGEFASIRDRLVAEQRQADAAGDGVDHLFDIPVELALALAGFRHDQDIEGAAEEPFECLERIGGAKSGTDQRPWWRRLLG